MSMLSQQVIGALNSSSEVHQCRPLPSDHTGAVQPSVACGSVSALANVRPYRAAWSQCEVGE